MTRRRRRTARATAPLLCLTVAAACSSGAATQHPAARAVPTLKKQSNTMLSATSGYATLPYGQQWVLLRTTDGWHSATNATPPAVPTGGGLAFAARNGAAPVSVAVGPFDRLLVSPLLEQSKAGAVWDPSQLSAALADSPSSIAYDGAVPTAVTTSEGGTLVRRRGAAWAVSTSAHSLHPAGGLTLDTVGWGSDGLGWLAGTSDSNAATLYRTTDHGQHWSPVDASAGAAAARPCGEDAHWVVPVVDASHTLRLLRTHDAGRSWQVGAALPASSDPVRWSCSTNTTWLIDASGGHDHLMVSNDDGADWHDAGVLPAGITSLSSVSPTSAFADGLDHGSPAIWTLTMDPNLTVTAATLPSWLSTVGGMGMGS